MMVMDICPFSINSDWTKQVDELTDYSRAGNSWCDWQLVTSWY